MFRRLRRLFREEVQRRETEALHTFRLTEQALENGLARYRFAGSLVSGKVVLDVACDRGYGTAHLLRSGARRVVGVDISERALDYARQQSFHQGINFIRAEASRLPFKEGSFQVIVSFETLEHLTESDKFLSEVARNLSQSGFFILSTPNRRVFSPFFRSSYSPLHQKEYTLGELVALLRRYFARIDFFGQKPISRWDLLHYGQRFYHRFLPRRIRQSVSRLVPGAKDFRTSFSRRRSEIIPLSEICGGEPMYFVAVATKARFTK